MKRDMPGSPVSRSKTLGGDMGGNGDLGTILALDCDSDFVADTRAVPPLSNK